MFLTHDSCCYSVSGKSLEFKKDVEQKHLDYSLERKLLKRILEFDHLLDLLGNQRESHV